MERALRIYKGVVKAASSYAFNRHIKVGTIAGVAADVESMKVQRNDFLAAIDEVRPAFGVADVELQQCVQNHILPFAPHIEVGRLCRAEMMNNPWSECLILMVSFTLGIFYVL